MQLYELPTLPDGADNGTDGGDVITKGRAMELPSHSRGLSALETLAEVARQSGITEPKRRGQDKRNTDSTRGANDSGATPTKAEDQRHSTKRHFEEEPLPIEEQWTPGNPPGTYDDERMRQQNEKERKKCK
jgi:hypothetical protein